MDYSERVNSKKGAGGIAGTAESNVHTKRRIQDLLATQVLDLEHDPYVFRNHLGLLECKLCLTTHVSESSYISHLGGRKHGLNLERRRLLDEKYNHNKEINAKVANLVSINNTEKRSWQKIGKPEFNVTKIRHPDTFRLGLLLQVKYPNITIEEPIFRIMSYYELSSKNQNIMLSYLDRESPEVSTTATDEVKPDVNAYQYLVISGEPYENIGIAIPNDKEIDKPIDITEMSENYWWFWDNDSKEFFFQFLYKS